MGITWSTSEPHARVSRGSQGDGLSLGSSVAGGPGQGPLQPRYLGATPAPLRTEDEDQGRPLLPRPPSILQNIPGHSLAPKSLWREPPLGPPLGLRASLNTPPPAPDPPISRRLDNLARQDALRGEGGERDRCQPRGPRGPAGERPAEKVQKRGGPPNSTASPKSCRVSGQDSADTDANHLQLQATEDPARRRHTNHDSHNAAGKLHVPKCTAPRAGAVGSGHLGVCAAARAGAVGPGRLGGCTARRACVLGRTAFVAP